MCLTIAKKDIFWGEKVHASALFFKDKAQGASVKNFFPPGLCQALNHIQEVRSSHISLQVVWPLIMPSLGCYYTTNEHSLLKGPLQQTPVLEDDKTAQFTVFPVSFNWFSTTGKTLNYVVLQPSEHDRSESTLLLNAKKGTFSWIWIFKPFKPAAWGSQGHPAPRLRPPQARRRCGSVRAGCPDPPAPWSFSSEGSPPGQQSRRKCSPPCAPGSLCTSGAGSWWTSWRWLSRSGRWLFGKGLQEITEFILNKIFKQNVSDI